MRALFQRFRTLPRATVLAFVTTIVLVAGLGIATATSGGGTSEPTTASGPTDTSPSPTGASDPSGSGSSSDGSQDGSGTGGVNNEVVVFNRTDGSFLNRAGFATTRVTSDTVDNQNAAAAYSECTDCRTVAVAVQVVLVQSNANVVTPSNLAVALNYGCHSCETFAGAYQYVVSTDGLVRFTPEGQAEMTAIQNQIRELAATDLPFPQLDAQLGALVDQLWATVDAEMVKLGIRFEGTPSGDVDVDTSEGGPTPTATPTPGASATEAATEDQATEPEPSSEATPTPGDDPTPTPSPSETVSPTPTPTPTG